MKQLHGRTLVLALGALLALAGCAKHEMSAESAAVAADAVQSPEGAFLAYEHTVQLQLPGKDIAPRVKAVSDACQSAKFGDCAVLNVSQQGGDTPSGSIKLRIAPKGVEPIIALASEKGEGHAVYRTAMLTNPFFEDVPLLVDDVRVARNGKDYTLLDNAGNAVRVAMPEETFIDILAITGGNPFASLVIVNGDIWELKSIWYNKEYHTWRDERN